MLKTTHHVAGLLITLAAGALMLAPSLAKETPKDKLVVIPVAKAFTEPEKHEGRIGLEGTVVEVDAKEPFFVILTPNPPGSCQEECCAPKRFTVHVPKGKFEGKLPKKDTKVVAVGDLKPLTAGFDFKVLEVRQADKVVFSKKMTK